MLFSTDKLLPSMVALIDHFHCVLLVHEALSQSKDIWRLSIWNLVCSVPFTDSIQRSWKFTFYIFNIVQERCPFIFSINYNDLPVTLSFINHTKDSKNLHWADFSWVDNLETNFTDIKRIVVSAGTISIRVDESRIFPCLWEATIVEENVSLFELTQLSLLGILLDWVSHFVSCDFKLFSCELWDFANKVKVWSRFLCFFVDVGKTNIVPERNFLLYWSLFLKCFDSVFKSIFFSMAQSIEILSRSMGILSLQSLHG
mmetsp:Transcript_5112/g.7897  ORF Transcript_5112/g.7897 Transcript_5112/m.7897 type:complete len:257 (-) Transcript_5112:112-882(-)